MSSKDPSGSWQTCCDALRPNRSVRANPKQAIGSVSLTLRAAAIVLVVVRHASALALKVSINRVLRRQAHISDLIGSTVLGLIEELGPAFIKVGQILSCRPDLLPESIIRKLSSLQDAVAPLPFETIKSAVQQETGKHPFELFLYFDPIALASGSVAQVHRAQLDDGRWVAVKIRRPGIRDALLKDVALLASLSKLAGQLPALRNVPVKEIAHQVSSTLVEQVDFCLEAQRAIRFARQLSSEVHVRVPHVYTEFSSETILVMSLEEDLRCISSNNILGDRSKLAERFLDLIYKMLFVHGILHVDLHLGNVMLQGDNRIVLLDFGFTSELSANVRHAFADFFWSLRVGNGDRCARILLDHAAAKPKHAEEKEFVAAVCRLVSQYSRATASQFSVGTFSWELFDIHRRCKIIPSTQFTFAILKLFVAEGIVREIDPKIDFQDRAKFVLPPVLARLQ